MSIEVEYILGLWPSLSCVASWGITGLKRSVQQLLESKTQKKTKYVDTASLFWFLLIKNPCLKLIMKLTGFYSGAYLHLLLLGCGESSLISHAMGRSVSRGPCSPPPNVTTLIGWAVPLAGLKYMEIHGKYVPLTIPENRFLYIVLMAWVRGTALLWIWSSRRILCINLFTCFKNIC